MATRTGLLLLAFLGAVACLHFVVADEVVINNAGGVESFETSQDEDRNSGLDMSEGDDDVEFAQVADAATELGDENSPAHRILLERVSKRCRSRKHCKKHFKKPGCCKKRCVNLASDNKNCGRCGKCCKTNKGYHCKSGKCRKVKKSSSHAQCSRKKKCKKGLSCCHPGKCVNLTNNIGHCGKCCKRCGHGSVCCKGKCINIKHDSRNCGRCGKRCGYTKKCCHGYCKNVLGNDEHHCGACGKKCHTKCQFGMCGYGHQVHPTDPR